MADKPFAEYAQRNANAILEILRREFRDCRTVLEIGSGTGQHAVHFASRLKYLSWQTSDLDENHAGIRAWIDDAELPNVQHPISLDVTKTNVTVRAYDAVFSSNTAHIMSYDGVVAMFERVGKTLRQGGVFCLYGPFQRAGRFNTESNAQFDRSLRRRDPAMGIRDLDSLDELATAQGMQRNSLYAVPANNLVALWQRT